MALETLSAAQRVVRLALVGAVLGLEFWFVVFVYHLDDAVDSQAVQWARLDTLVRTGSDPVSIEMAARALVEAGSPIGSQELTARVSRWQATDADSPPPAAVRQAVQQVGTDVRARQAGADRLAVLLVAMLFVAVCGGWFTWFRRLARRHRGVQRELTKRETRATEEQRLTALVRNSTDVVITLDGDSTVTFVSAATATVLGRPEKDVEGRRMVDLVDELDRDVLVKALTDADTKEHEVAFRMTRPDGSTIEVEGTLNDLHADPVVRSWVLTIRDVTQRRELERSLAHQAFHDPLTGLANRHLFGNRLEHALLRPGTDDRASVLFLDVDDFKLVNDSLGHGVGDQALVQVASRLLSCAREHDTVARLGGDEFAVLMEDTGLEQAERFARTLQHALSEPVQLGPILYSPSVSVGVAGSLRADDTGADLLRHADMAMYAVKDGGKGGVARYDATLHTKASAQLAYRIEIREAIATDQLLLHFQPTVEVQTQQVTGFEALVRWQHPTKGLLAPSEFIPIAEQAGLMTALGEWVLDRACESAKHLRTLRDELTMSVNVSAQQLASPEFPSTVLACLQRTCLPPTALVLEVTESAIHQDVETSVASLTLLRQHGIRIAIDDFGTGYNSLATLSRLPVDILKVDKSFMDPLADSDDAVGVVESILGLSRALGLHTVAEGVEDLVQVDWLRRQGDLLGQGFFWSRPVPFAAARVLARDGLAPAIPPHLALVPNLNTDHSAVGPGREVDVVEA